MKQYLQSWNIVRFLRLAIGIAVVVQGILVHDWLLTILGGLFSLMPLMNVGCGANGACSTGPSLNRPTESLNPNKETE